MNKFIKTIKGNKPLLFIKKNIYLILFFILLLVSLRVPLLSAIQGKIMGHNWDWSFPDVSFLAHRISFFSLYAWNNANSGYSNFLTTSQLIPNLFVTGLSYILPPQFIPIILIAIFCSVGFIFFKKFLDVLFESARAEHYIPSFLFGFSPFLFNEIIGGSWYMWLSFAFTPVFLFCFFSFIKSQKFYLGLLSAIVLTLVFSSTQNFILLILFTLLYFLVVDFKRIKLFLLGALKVGGLFLLLGLYWILSIFGSIGELGSMVVKNSTADKFASVANSTQNFFDIVSLTGYLDRNMYLYSFPGVIRIVFILSVIAIFAVILIKMTKDRKLAKLIALFLIFVFFIKGGNDPFSALTMWIFHHFSFLALYRSPQHLMFLAALIMPVMLAFAISKIANSKVKTAILILVVCIINGWWLYGDFGNYQLVARSRDHIDYYKLSENLKDAYAKNEDAALNQRYLFLPSVFSPKYLGNENQNQAQGGQPEYMYLKNTTNYSDYNLGFSFADEIDKYFCGMQNLDLGKYMTIFSYKTVVLRDDILPFATKCGAYNLWDSSKVRSVISNSEIVEKTAIDGVYEVKDEYFNPVVSIGDKILVSDRGVADIAKIISEENYRIGDVVYLKDQNRGKEVTLDNASGSQIDNQARVEYKEISPGKYKVRIHQAGSGLIPLVLNQNFNSGWKVYKDSSKIAPAGDETGQTFIKQDENQLSSEELYGLVKSKDLTDLGSGKLAFISKNFRNSIQNDNIRKGSMTETLFKKPLFDEENHFVANGYANSWLINPSSLCTDSKICQKRDDNSFDINLIIEYKNQGYLYIGIIVSSVILLISLFISIIQYVKKTKQS